MKSSSALKKLQNRKKRCWSKSIISIMARNACSIARCQGDKGTSTQIVDDGICHGVETLSSKVQCSLGQDWCLLTTTGEALFGGMKHVTNLGCKWFVFRLKVGFLLGCQVQEMAEIIREHGPLRSMECLKDLLEPVLSRFGNFLVNTCNASNDH